MSLSSRAFGRPIGLIVLVVGIALLGPVFPGVPGPGNAHAQTSFPLTDLMPRPRGSALGGQALAGDLLSAGADPTVAADGAPGVQLAAGRDVLGLQWGGVGGRFRLFGHPLAVAVGTLSYGRQYRTGLDDRLGVFGGTFEPSDAGLSMATIVLARAFFQLGAGLTWSLARIDEATASAVSLAFSGRRQMAPFEIRGGISDLGRVISPFADRSGTHLPARLRGGVAWQSPGAQWEVSAEGTWRLGRGQLLLGAGTEWKPLREGALRLGIIRGDGLDALDPSGAAAFGLTAGAGWRLGDWSFDYVWRPGGLFGSGQFFAVGWHPSVQP